MSAWPYRPIATPNQAQRRHGFVARVSSKGYSFNSRFRGVIINLPSKEE